MSAPKRKKGGRNQAMYVHFLFPNQSAHFPWRGVSKGAQGDQGCHAIRTLHMAGNTHPREAFLLNTFMGDDTQT